MLQSTIGKENLSVPCYMMNSDDYHELKNSITIYAVLL